MSTDDAIRPDDTASITADSWQDWRRYTAARAAGGAWLAAASVPR